MTPDEFRARFISQLAVELRNLLHEAVRRAAIRDLIVEAIVSGLPEEEIFKIMNESVPQCSEIITNGPNQVH
jgi:hypothetical protein